MTNLSLALFAGCCFFLIAWGMRRPGRICEFPFLAGATFAGFVLPQAIGLTWGAGLAPAGLDEALVMSILCSVMCYLGYVVSDTPMTLAHWEFDNDRLLIVSVVLSAIGGICFFLISRLPDEVVGTEARGEGGGWTGLPVAYLFFAQVLRYGFAIALLLYLKLRSKLALGIIIFDCIFLFEWIVIRGRRSFAIEFVLFILCAFWFARRRTLPRWAMLVVLAVGTITVCAAGTYRATVYKDQQYGGALRHEIPWEDIIRIDFIDVFLTYNQEESWEFQNCAYCIHATDTFDGGLSYWNEAVYSYVPAQLLGAEFKRSLQFDLPGEIANPNSPQGTTSTGMGDSYQAFGWFGCFVFFLFAFMMRRIFETAQAGNLAAQLTYMIIVTSAMVAITHHTKWFLMPWVHMTAFLVPGLLWARKGVAPNCPEANSQAAIV